MMKPLFYLILIALFYTSCTSDKPHQALELQDHSNDSFKIVELFNTVIQHLSQSDSIISVAENISKKDSSLAANFHFLKSRFLVQTGQLDAASELINEHHNNKTDTSSLYSAKYFNLLGSISAMKGNHENSIQYFKQALRIYEKFFEVQPAALLKFNLANIFLSRLDYKTAYQYAATAHKDLLHIQDTTYLPLAKGLLSITLINTDGDLNEATTLAHEALEISNRQNNIQGQLLSYYALGEIDAKNDNYEKSIISLEKAVEIGEKFNMHQLLLATNAALLNCYLQLEKYEKAIENGLNALKLAKQQNNTDIQYSLNKNLAFAYEGQNNPSSGYQYLKKSEKLFKEKANIENQKAIQELMIQYEVEKKNNFILEQTNNIQKKRYWISLLIFGIVVLLVTLFAIRRFAAQKNKLLSEQKDKELLIAVANGEENERGRIAAELHDGVASQLIGLKMQMEQHTQLPIHQQMVSILNQTHQEVRLIAHNLMPIDFTKISLTSAIENFCVQLTLNEPHLEFFSNDYNMEIEKNKAHVLYRAVQEIVQNTLKHAQAKLLTVQILKSADNYKISIEDDGVGMSTEQLKNSRSINNMIANLSKFNAVVFYDIEAPRGTNVTIEFKKNKPV